MILTNWYPGHIKPVREGVYQRVLPWTGNAGYSRWDGRFWCSFEASVVDAAIRTTSSGFQDLKWRGVAK